MYRSHVRNIVYYEQIHTLIKAYRCSGGSVFFYSRFCVCQCALLTFLLFSNIHKCWYWLILSLMCVFFFGFFFGAFFFFFFDLIESFFCCCCCHFGTQKPDYEHKYLRSRIMFYARRASVSEPRITYRAIEFMMPSVKYTHTPKILLHIYLTHILLLSTRCRKKNGRKKTFRLLFFLFVIHICHRWCCCYCDLYNLGTHLPLFSIRLRSIVCFDWGVVNLYVSVCLAICVLHAASFFPHPAHFILRMRQFYPSVFPSSRSLSLSLPIFTIEICWQQLPLLL